MTVDVINDDHGDLRMDEYTVVPTTLTRSLELLTGQDSGGFSQWRTVLFQQVLAESLWSMCTDALLVSDQEGIILAANPQFCRLFDVEETDLVGKMMWYPVTPSSDADPDQESRLWIHPCGGGSVILVEMSTYVLNSLLGPFSVSVFNTLGRSPQLN